MDIDLLNSIMERTLQAYDKPMPAVPFDPDLPNDGVIERFPRKLITVRRGGFGQTHLRFRRAEGVR